MTEKKPLVGFVGNPLNDFGGVVVSEDRTIRLLEDHVAMVPIGLEASRSEDNWAGKIEPVRGGRAYRIHSADFRADRALAPELGDAMLSTELRKRGWAEKLARIGRERGFDAIHVYGAFQQRSFIGAYAAAVLEIPLIVTFCGQDLEAQIFGKHLAQITSAARMARLITCKSEQSRRLVTTLLQPSAPVRIIRNSATETHFDPGAKMERWGDRPIIGCFGEFRRVVGLDTLLEAYALLLKKGRMLTLALGGPIRQTEAAYFNRKIEALPPEARVWRLGKVPHKNMLAALRMCDVVAAPSFADTSPNKILEAMLAGVPLVTTTAGGIPQMVRHEQDALLVEPGEAGPLAEPIERMLDDRELRERCTANARRRVTTEFTPEKERGEWIAAYREAGLCS